MKHKIICIVGPTASGKTKLAVELAKKFDGQIISADSRQVYRGLDVGTGKDLKEYGDIKYHLIDICEPEEKFTLFDWLKLARTKIKELHKNNILPIVVGGTGLYVQSLVEGFELVNNVKRIVNSQKLTRKELEIKSLKQLREIYNQQPATNNQLDLDNPHRLIRAIEKAQLYQMPTKQKPDFEVLQIGITHPREKLYEKIDRRVNERFAKEKMLEEVAELLAHEISPKWLISLGLEYRFISTYLLDNFKFQSSNFKSISYDKFKNTPEYKQMTQELKYKTHAYARRQLTWFRRFPEIKWVASCREAEKIVDKYLKM